jgi:hypothetical protein
MTHARIAEIIPDVRAAAVELSQIWPLRRYLGGEPLSHVGASVARAPRKATA